MVFYFHVQFIPEQQSMQMAKKKSSSSKCIFSLCPKNIFDVKETHFNNLLHQHSHKNVINKLTFKVSKILLELICYNTHFP